MRVLYPAVLIVAEDFANDDPSDQTLTLIEKNRIASEIFGTIRGMLDRDARTITVQRADEMTGHHSYLVTGDVR